jgi:hypothetical protein
VLGPRQVAWVDLVGSGVETIAHLQENGRIVLMWCAFAGPPKIVRLHGRGAAVLADDPRFAELWSAFEGQERHAVRSLIEVEVGRVSDSCGYAVPLMDHVGDRDLLTRSHSRRDDAALAEYGETKNRTSIDGLPALVGLGASAVNLVL